MAKKVKPFMTREEYNAYHREYYKKNKERIKSYYSSDEQRAKRNAYSRKWIENNRKKWNKYQIERYRKNKKKENQVKEQEAGDPTQQ